MKTLRLTFCAAAFCSLLFTAGNSSAQGDTLEGDLTWSTTKAKFNSLQAYPRLCSVYGVNCPPCRTHRTGIWNTIMQECDNPDLRWTIHWFEDQWHPATRADAVSQSLLIPQSDTRIEQWWCPMEMTPTFQDSAARYFSPGNFGYVWDITMFWDSGTVWTGQFRPDFIKNSSPNAASWPPLLDSVKAYNRCYATAAGIPVQNALSEAIVYPNPTQEEITIHSHAALQGETRLMILDLSGKLISDKLISTDKGLYEKIDVRNYATGVYFYQVVNNSQQVMSGKFVIE